MAKKNFKNFASLSSITTVLNEVDNGLNDPFRTIKESAIPELLGVALGAGVGGAIGFLALVNLGIAGLGAAGITSGLAAAGAVVGGGMVAGIGVLAAPAVILGAGGVAIANGIKNKKLNEEKRRLYNMATVKQNAIIKELQKDINIAKERADYLNGLNILLKSIIKDLKEDLGL